MFVVTFSESEPWRDTCARETVILSGQRQVCMCVCVRGLPTFKSRFSPWDDASDWRPGGPSGRFDTLRRAAPPRCLAGEGEGDGRAAVVAVERPVNTTLGPGTLDSPSQTDTKGAGIICKVDERSIVSHARRAPARHWGKGQGEDVTSLVLRSFG